MCAKIKLIEIEINSDPSLTTKEEWKHNYDFIKLYEESVTKNIPDIDNETKANLYYKIIFN